MNTQEQANIEISMCNELLRRELAAVEVYRLAVALLDNDLGTPDYRDLRERHQEQADCLIDHIVNRGGEPCSLKACWDRPNTAVLCAATLYGFESPHPQLRELEDEIVRAYRIAGNVDKLGPPLEESLSSQLVPAARASFSVIDAGTAPRISRDEESGTEASVSREEAADRTTVNEGVA